MKRSLGLGLWLIASGLLAGESAAQPPSRLMLQQVGTNSAIVKWRGGPDRACWAKSLADLGKANWPKCAAATATAGDHKEALLTDLAPDHTYYYHLGNPGPGAGSSEQQFRTAPDGNKPPKDGNVHIWLVGDSGTQTELSSSGGFPHAGKAAQVKQGFLDYNAVKAGGEPIDLFVLLGDNAYLEGTDAQWQGAFFDVYPEIMRKAAVWPTLGNHEMGGAPFDLSSLFGLPPGSVVRFVGGASFSSDPATYDDNNPATVDDGPPYLKIFTLPTAGEVGGVPSGTEQYYSMNYGNVHLVSLDGQLSNADPDQRGAMRQWLTADLAANDRDWTIVIFHHPPYSKGINHNSDAEQREIDLRVEFTPVFEQYGVDVVYSGHSHSFERSYYLNGHTGLANSFDPAVHAELNADGEPASGDGAEKYSQVSTGSGADDKVVYTVAGSSGKNDSPFTPPCAVDPVTGEEPQFFCRRSDWLEHPAHYYSASVMGSVVVDATATSLRSRFVDRDGAVRDEFTIKR